MANDPINHNGDRGYDPTPNVLALVDAAVKRLDDLHSSETRRLDERLCTFMSHVKQLADAEAKRIDAIRAVDVAAVAVASERATQQAAVLASQVVSSAETLRTLVASTATTVATQLTNLSIALTERLTLLERSQYETKGRSGVSAPILMMIAAGAAALVTFLIQRALSMK
jgi:3-oxoacyl-ACP reductase-like protein